MAWIRVETALVRHPKTLRLATHLGIERPHAAGLVLGLLSLAGEFAEDGDLSRFKDEEIAASVCWAGDPGVLMAAYRAVGWLDKNTVHDWLDYAGQMLRERERSRRRRQESAGKPTCDRGPTETPVPVAPRPDRNTRAGRAAATVRNGVKDLKPFADSGESAQQSFDEGFAEWWGYYRRISNRDPGSKADANVLYRYWRERGAEKMQLVLAAETYLLSCVNEQRPTMDARTFLAKKPCRWRDWLDPERSLRLHRVPVVETGIPDDELLVESAPSPDEVAELLKAAGLTKRIE